MHSNVLPGSAISEAGHTTVAWILRSVRMLCCIAAATLAVLIGTGVGVVLEEDEPQAPRSAAQASAAVATTPPRRARRARVLLGESGLGFLCMRA